MPNPATKLILAVASIACSAGLGACGSQAIEVDGADPQVQHGAELFAERCSGCHTLEAAGTQGSGNRTLKQQGPDLDERVVTAEDALFAIRNGGFSGAIMPQNIIVGADAEDVAAFIAAYSGGKVEEAPLPGDK